MIITTKQATVVMEIKHYGINILAKQKLKANKISSVCRY